MPTPRISRPLLSRSRVAVSLASCHGRRRGTGVIIAPRRLRVVLAATTAMTSHGSTIGGPPPLVRASKGPRGRGGPENAGDPETGRLGAPGQIPRTMAWPENPGRPRADPENHQAPRTPAAPKPAGSENPGRSREARQAR